MMDNRKMLAAPDLLDGVWRVYGRREGCSYESGVLTTEDCWAAAEHLQMENFDFRFSARAPESAAQVQIWACFRQFNRDYRYMVGLRGGANKQLYLARLGAVGYDQMLALRPLEWHPEVGTWYQIRVVCAGSTIAVYLNGDDTPEIVCRDDEAPFHSGCVALGGGFVAAQYRDVSLTEVAPNALEGVRAKESYLQDLAPTPEMKQIVRRQQRAQYRPYGIPRLPEDRMELSLDGKWLFIPEQEVAGDPMAPGYDDSAAHVISVPSSWVPLHAWLEGETMGEDLNKGFSDNYYLEESLRCSSQTFDYQNTWTAWYRHYIDLPAGIENKRVVLDFEAIALVSSVYCNGHKVHENIGMFTPQQIDISNWVRAGRNVIAVEVARVLPTGDVPVMESDSIDNNYARAREETDSNIPVSECEHREFCTEDLPHGFYSGNPGGIWRSVRLIISDRLHVEDLWFRPTAKNAYMEITCQNGRSDSECVTLSYSLVHKTTGEHLCSGNIETFSLNAGEKRVISFRTPDVTPRLWGPGTPNLYRLTLTLMQDGNIVDTYREQVGFRTVRFEGSTLIYNGKPIWVRGGNHMPAHVRPNDADLARTFISTALEHNLMATRTHVAPWGSSWLDAADELGMMISFEGPWGWLMLTHIPSQRSLEIWQTELRALYRRNRNRPSLFLLTLNNEMNFYLIKGSDDVVREKGYLVQGGLKIAREEFPDLPLVCDSGYFRGPTTMHGRYKRLSVANGRYERIIQPNHFDDGDMDDPHFYFGWYEPSFFHFMNGEFGRDMTLPGRPCMSQECSVGYCRAEDGHGVRAYLFSHQTPQTTTGKRAYEHNDPRYFQHNHAFLLQGLVEMFRRVEHSRTCGVLLFSFETWFYFHHDSKRLQPMESARRLQLAYQPVLASAELFGRHFYAGSELRTTVTLINDSNEGRMLHDPVICAELTADGQVLDTQCIRCGDTDYFALNATPLCLQIPKKLSHPRQDAKLVLKVWEGETLLSVNDYDILLAEEDWAKQVSLQEPVWYLQDDGLAEKLLKHYGIAAQPCEAAPEAGSKGRMVVCKTISEEQAADVRAFAEAGGKVVMLNQRALPDAILAGKQAAYTEECMEIMTMNVPESSVFSGIDELDTVWFPNGRDVPYVAYGRYTLDRMDPDICALGETLQWHNYIPKPTEYINIGGSPLFAMRAGKGAILVSSVRTDADDPVASRLTGNILVWDFDEM